MKQILLAQSMTIGGQQISGPLVGITTLGDVINKAMLFVIPFAAILLLFVFLLGGYGIMTSQGIPEKIKAAQSKITAGLIGFVLLISAYLLVRILSLIFGLGNGIF